MSIHGMKHLRALMTALLSCAAGLAAAGTTTVNLTAQPSQKTLPDGAVAKMWQLCGAAVANADGTASTGTASAACSATQWAPGPTITVAAGDTLSIVLTNQLKVPTSLVVLGQLGGGLGQPVRMSAPIVHNGATQTTFPAAGAADVAMAPPAQVARVQSFATEVAAAATTTLTWANLKPGTYIYESGTLPSLQVPMGLYGVLVVTHGPVPAVPAVAADLLANPPVIGSAGASFAPGIAYPATGTRAATTYDSDVALLFSEIDPVQNAAVDAAATAGASITKRFDDPSCTATAPCYPPAVNYTPTYFLINGKPFDSTNPTAQMYPAGATYSSGNILLRLANAGSRLHVPAAVGLPFQLIAEDGNLAPGKVKVQNEVTLPAGKTQDVIVTPAVASGAYTPASFAIFDRQLSTATSGSNGGMQAFLQINGAATPTAVTPTLVADSYKVPFATAINGNVKLNDIAAGSIALGNTHVANGTLALATDGSFVYTPNATFTGGTDTFSYTASNTGSQEVMVTLTVGTQQGAPIAVADTYFSAVQSQFKSATPGLLANDTDAGGKLDRTLKVVVPATAPTCGKDSTVDLHADGSFSVLKASGSSCSFTYQVVNSQGTLSAAAIVTINFGVDKNGVALKSGLKVDVVDAKTGAKLDDYRWLVQEDLTFKGDTSKTPSLNTRTIGTSFHRSHMTVVASGCLGAKSCGSGQSLRTDSTTVDAATQTKGARHVVTDAEALDKSVGLDKLLLDPTKNYYISILPGDALDDAGGHLMGGVAVSKAQVANAGSETLVIKTSATPVNPGQLSVFIYEDNNATNNQYDTGEQGLGGFNIIVVDAVGRSGDPAGQQTYDMFGMPLSNALLGTPGCPDEVNGKAANANAGKGDDGQNLVGVVYTCPNASQAQTDAALAADLALDSTGATTTNRDALNLQYSLAGHALIKYLEPARYDIIAHPAAWREAGGERWWQVETLEGTPAQDAFVGTNEPRYFQEFGPPGFHTSIGFVNPDRVTKYGLELGGVAAANDASHHSIKGQITSQHMSRPSAVRLFDSGSYDLLSSTVCQVVLNSGGGTGPAIAVTECNPDGSFKLDGIPDGSYEIQIWDRWLDQIIQAQAVTLAGADYDFTNIPVLSWFTQHDQNLYLDLNGNGRYDANEPGIPNLVMTNRYRNGSISNQTATDSFGNGILVELFPLFNWYVSEADTTRFKQTGVNVIVDGGGPVNNSGSRYSRNPDGTTTSVGNTPNLINSTYQAISAGEAGCNPDRAQAPEIVGADCPADHTTDRVEIPGAYSYGIQSFISQRNRIDWGRAPYVAGENGGIVGTVVYSSTRPFDDQRFNIQNIWAPLVPRVTVNLYRKQVNGDGSTSLVLVDTTKTSSWDDWVQTVIGSDGKSYILDSDGIGLRDPTTGLLASGVTAGKQVNLQCPGQRADDVFLTYTLGNQNPGGTPDQFRCYDGFHVWNQAQPAPYDGHYQFPSADYLKKHPEAAVPVCKDQVTIGGKSYNDPNKCQTLVSLPPADYIVEAVTPDGYEIVKEEDKNIFTGDQFNGPAAQQFAGLGNVFILPDQATLNNANPYNNRNADGLAINATSNLGNTTTAGYTVAMPECVGDTHRVPDYLTIFPQAGLVAPFAGMDRPLCDRKLVHLKDQTQANANFFIFTPVPLAANGAGIILDDASSEFNAAAPDFGEKAAVPNVPISVKDFSGTELVRTYADQWGAYNLMYPSSWTVNPPTPSGYLPNMLVNCINDPGPIAERDATGKLTGRMVTDPQFNQAYSNFCYTIPFMPGQTTYLDTPVLPVAAFAQGGNPADCEYPDSTPAIKRVNASIGFGPYLTTAGGTLIIDALGDQIVPNPAYAGPFAKDGPASLRTLTRHYGFGSTKGAVTIGGTTYSGNQITTWNDQQIIVAVPANASGGQLVVNTFAGKSSVDGVTVTVENKPPTRVDANGGADFTTIQAAIDVATPGDLILINEGTYNELVVMWKPVRLQGTGGASVYINATKYPTTKLATWRPVINAAFGVDINTGNNTVPAQVDALPTQEITGGIVLLEPSVLGSEEGPGIAVLAKGINDFTGNATGAPLGTSNAECARNTKGGYDSVTVTFNLTNGAQTVANPGLSNFACAPSRIDGIGFTGGDSGGGIYVNGWAHNLEIANNRVFGNAGAYNGGIRIGVPYLELEALPSVTGNGSNTVQPGFGYDKNIKIHHNFVAKNGTVEAPVGAGGAGGGVSICTGTDGYSIDHNWICGNYSSSDGGGIGHIGFSQNGKITNNTILFNESTQQTSAVSGGGIAVVAEPIIAGNLALGTGSVTIDANVIRGNLASGGKGGGIFLAGVNGLDVANTPNNPSLWFTATVTNNIIDNNVAGWAGGGVSLFDTVLATIVNNTIASNDSVGVAGVVLANGVGRPEPAGLVSQLNSTALAAAIGNKLDAAHREVSNPTLVNNIIWKNRSFYYGSNNRLCAGNNPAAVGGACTQLPVQTTTGQCAANTPYWEIGLLDDASTTPGTRKLIPASNVMTSITGYASPDPLNPNRSEDPLLADLYCNGSRAVPEFPAVINPPTVKSYQVAATSDEGNNYVSVKYGPLTTIKPTDANGTNYVAFGDYHLAANATSVNSSAVDHGAVVGNNHDVDGDARPQGPRFEIGADEVALVRLSPKALDFGRIQIGQTSGTQTVTLTNLQAVAMPITSVTLGGTNVNNFAMNNACIGSLAGNASCNITVSFTPNAVGSRVATITLVDGAGTQTVGLSGTGVAASGSLSLATLAFGTQQVNVASAARTVTLSNTGVGPLNYTSIASNSSRYVQTNTCASPLAVGASCTISVVFTPNATGNQNSTLTVNVPAGTVISASNTVALTGTGANPAVTRAPTSLSFTAQAVGTTSAAQVVTVTNSGAVPLLNPVVSLTGTAAANYAQSNTCTSPVAVGATCTISVSFTPTLSGTRTATVNLAVTGNAALTTVALTGVGTVPVTLAPNPLAFGSVATNGGLTTRTVTVTNNGTTTLTVSAAPSITGQNGNGANFTAPPTGCANGTTLAAAGGSCTITVSYTPSGTTGTRTATLNIGVSGAALTDALSVTTVTPTNAVTPAGPLAFGPVARGSSSAVQTVTVTNNGPVPLTLSATPITFSANAGEYTLSANSCTANLVIAVNGTCSVGVAFTPTAANGTGNKSATLRVNSNAVTKTVNVTATAN